MTRRKGRCWPARILVERPWGAPKRWLCFTLVALAVTFKTGACATEEVSIPGQLEPVRPGDTHRAYYVIDGILQEIDYESWNGYRLFEGDIVLDPEGEVPREQAQVSLGLRNPDPETEGQVATHLHTVSQGALWPGAVVPYVLDPDVPRVAELQQAMEHIELETPIRFVERRGEAVYLQVVALAQEAIDEGVVCRAHVGWYAQSPGSERARNLWLGPRCDYRAAVHELGHVLGLWHEHTRPDRDQYVIYYPEHLKYNIAEHNYKTRGSDSGGYQLGEYDISSVMHYSSFQGAWSYDHPVLVRRSDRSTWRRDPDSGLSKLDAQGISELYRDQIDDNDGNGDQKNAGTGGGGATGTCDRGSTVPTRFRLLFNAHAAPPGSPSQPWVDVNDAEDTDSQGASVRLGAGEHSDFLTLTHAGNLNIPADATRIVDVRARARLKASPGTTPYTANAWLVSPAGVSRGSETQTVHPHDPYRDYQFGAAGATWGGSSEDYSISVADARSPDFGVRFQMEATEGATRAAVDSAFVQVTYEICR